MLKLAANGQDLGGSLLFDRRLGFSGTPSDLLPVEMGRCVYEKGDTAQMLNFLISSNIVSFDVMDGNWNVKSLLSYIGNSSFHALIDTGALITGLNNLAVARYLLENGLPQMEGVVYLDEYDRKMILCRAGMKVVKLSQCKIPLEKRFTFYDQVHTTGMDIQQPLSAEAALTLGKDMNFRDYAQGAFRMRGIGKGQKIKLIIIPEVAKLIRTQVSWNLESSGILVFFRYFIS